MTEILGTNDRKMRHRSYFPPHTGGKEAPATLHWKDTDNVVAVLVLVAVIVTVEETDVQRVRDRMRPSLSAAVSGASSSAAKLEWREEDSSSPTDFFATKSLILAPRRFLFLPPQVLVASTSVAQV